MISSLKTKIQEKIGIPWYLSIIMTLVIITRNFGFRKLFQNSKKIIALKMSIISNIISVVVVFIIRRLNRLEVDSIYEYT